MSPSSATVSRRTVRALLAAGLACLIPGIAVLIAAVLPSASAQQQPAFEDFEGNATDCNEGRKPAGLEGELLLAGVGDASNAQVQGTVSGDENQFLNIVVLDPDLVITGTVVKGGQNGYRVYYGDPVADMTAPLLDNGKPPAISHWFVCGFEVDETPTDEPTTPNGEPTTPNGEPTTPNGEPTTPNGEPTTPNGEPTTPNGEPTDEQTTPSGPGLPKTGGSNGWLAAAGAGLLAAGVALVLAGRQAAGRHQA